MMVFRAIRIFIGYLFRPIYKLLVFLVFEVFAGLVFFFPNDLENPTINTLLGWMAWHWWAFIGLATIVVWTAIQATKDKLLSEGEEVKHQPKIHKEATVETEEQSGGINIANIETMGDLTFPYQRAKAKDKRDIEELGRLARLGRNMRTTGEAMIGQPLDDINNMVYEWQRATFEWFGDVYAVMKRINPGKAEWFSAMDYEQDRYPNVEHEGLQLYLNHHSERLHQLREFLRELD